MIIASYRLSCARHPAYTESPQSYGGLVIKAVSYADPICLIMVGIFQVCKNTRHAPEKPEESWKTHCSRGVLDVQF